MASTFANISGQKYVNQYDGEIRLTVVAGSPDGKVSLFTTAISTPSGQISLSSDPILGRTRAIQDIMNKRGSLGGSTQGEVQLQTRTTNFALKTDYAYLASDSKGIEVSRDVIEAILNGDGFFADPDGTTPFGKVYHKIFGTNGTMKNAQTTTQNKMFGRLFELDGMLKIPEAATAGGDAILVQNVRKAAYDKTAVMMMFEVVSKFDESNINGIRVVYCSNADIKWSDAKDANEISFTQTQLADLRYIDNFFVFGGSTKESNTQPLIVNQAENLVPARIVKFGNASPKMWKAKITTPLTLTLAIGTTLPLPAKYVSLSTSTQLYETTAFAASAVAIGDLALVYSSNITTTGYGIYRATTAGDTASFALLKNSTTVADTDITAAEVNYEDGIYKAYDWNFESAAFTKI